MLQLKISILSLFFTSILFGQQHDDRLDSLQIIVEQLMKENHTVGLAIAVVEDDKVVYSNGFGYRNLESKLPVTPHTLFSVGSVTKQFTATLMGIYQGQGKLSIDDQPRLHLPYLYFYNHEMNQLVTISDLLAHRSGIGGVDGTDVFFPTNSIEQHLKRLPHLAPNSVVRERFDYSNMGYSILGGISEQISGKSWEENIKSEIFAPLQMARSNANLQDLQADNDFSYGYSSVKDSIFRVLYADQFESSPAGAINSSAHEMTQWVKMLLNKGIHQGKQIVPQAYLEQSFSEQQMINGSFQFDQKKDLLANAYGYGWFVNQYQNTYRVHHAGNVSGFTASVNLYPYKNIGIVILSNQGNSNLPLVLADIIFDQLTKNHTKNWQEYEVQVGEGRTPVKQIPAINTEQKPTHPLAAYCGKYKSKGYGVIEVLLEKEQLMIKFPAFKMALVHERYDTFYNETITQLHQNTPSFYINFQTNSTGDIAEININFARTPERFSKIN
ncbi:MAG: serine hydrolase [Saprospiraceae bacterium]